MSKFFDSFVDSVAGGLGSLATGAIGSLAGSLFGSGRDPAAEQHARNKELMGLQARYNSDLQHEGYALTMSNWLKQFNAQNLYNTPYAQFQRMLRAGLNPYVSNSEVTGTSSMGASASGSAPSVGLPSATLYDQSETYSNFADGISKLAQASGATIGNARINDKINAEIGDLLANKELKEVQAVIQGIEKDFLPKIRDQELKNKLKENLLLVAQALAKRSEAALLDAKFDTEKQIQALNAKEGELKDLGIASEALNYYYLIDFIEERLENLKADTAEKRAGATDKYASAQEHKAGAEEKSENAQYRRFENNLRSRFSYSYAVSYLNRLNANNQLAKADYDEAMLRLSRLKQLNNWRNKDEGFAELDTFLDWLASKIGLSISGSAGAAVTSSETVSHVLK